jgi:glycosyltransferase involved in cell wall biosynthesis
MRKVLIITYYWPPCGGSAVLRWLKFAKYLREFNWEPVVYTPSNPEPQEIDPSLVKDIPVGMEIITTKIWEPYTLYKLLTGKKKEDRLGVAMMSDKKKTGMLGKFSIWIRSNFFIPDPRRFWINPSVRYLSKYLKANPVEAVITTGPPHSMHLIGLGLKKKLGLKWIADFRDPWTNIDFYRELSLTRRADRRHRMLEKKVLQKADQVITVSPGMTKEFMATGIDHVITLTNGYDVEPLQTGESPDGKFSILHLGSMPKSRNPENLWKALSELAENNQSFASSLQIRLTGKIDISVSESLEKFKLSKYVVHEAFVPHDQTQKLLSNASVLLLCINNTPNAEGILTNKFFEYLSAQRPILSLGPINGDASVILSETGAGKMFGYESDIDLKHHIESLFELYSHHNLTVESCNIDKFSRKNLTFKLSEILNNLTAK